MTSSKLVSAAAIALYIALAACDRTPQSKPSSAPAHDANKGPSAAPPSTEPTTSAAPADPAACGKGTGTFTSSAAACGFKVVSTSAYVKGGRLHLRLSEVPEKLRVPSLIGCEISPDIMERRDLSFDVPEKAKGKVELETLMTMPPTPTKGHASYTVAGHGRASSQYADTGTVTVTRSDGSAVEGTFSFDMPKGACAAASKIEGTFKATICCRAGADPF